jgi:hypothetical protein
MESGKEVKKKINVLEAMHYIRAAWQQVRQQTIQNCLHKGGHQYQSMVMKLQTTTMMMMMMILANTGKNCVEPRNAISKATSQWIAM